MQDRERLKTDLAALGVLAAVVFVGLSLVSHDPADAPAANVFPPPAETMNTCGPIGALVAHSLRSAFGAGAWFFLVILAVLDARLFSRKSEKDLAVRGCGWLLLLMTICVACRTAFREAAGGSIHGSGGVVGAWGAAALETHFATGGTVLLLLTGFIVGMLLAADKLLFQLLRYLFLFPLKAAHRVSFGRPRKRASAEPLRVRESLVAAPPAAVQAPAIVAPAAALAVATPAAVEEVQPAIDAVPDNLPGLAADGQGESRASADEPQEPATIPLAEASAETEPARESIRINPPAAVEERREFLSRRFDAPETKAAPEFTLPTAELLEPAEPFPFEVLAEKARGAAAVLERTFQEFGLNVRVVEIDTGPVITQFELELEAGLRLSKVTALADDLAIALRVPSVRVVAPIPGKNTVGVEVPNDKQVMVRLRELIEACPDAIEKKRIPVFLGKDVSGRALVVDLAKMPHLLIAGRTGTGKSVCLNALILSILMSRTPDQVKMLMIDPKMVELSPYKRVPHLMHPVITDMKKAEAVLAWAVDKMEERYDLLARCGVRHLDSYNELRRDLVLQRLGIDPASEEAAQIPDKMPYIVIIADEMADMMMTSGKDVEGHIIRLAQKSRAVGIHLVLATQKPTVDVITGLIKSNLPARISFQVASRVDSRVVLDEMGAERLLGNGDMLYLMPGTSKITRAQGTYVSDGEVNQIIEFFGECEPQYSRELAQLSARSSGKSGIDAIRSRDELYEQAIDVVVREGRGSTSLLQRALGIGYGRAARLIDYMAEDGIVGDYNGSQAREVLYTPEQWAEIVAGSEAEPAPA